MLQVKAETECWSDAGQESAPDKPDWLDYRKYFFWWIQDEEGYKWLELVKVFSLVYYQSITQHGKHPNSKHLHNELEH